MRGSAERAAACTPSSSTVCSCCHRDERASAERAIVDAGLKSYSGEKGVPWVHGRDDVEVIGIADEHGTLRVGERAERLRLGGKVMLIPGHCDPTVNLHDWYVAIRRGRVEALWPITARGASI